MSPDVSTPVDIPTPQVAKAKVLAETRWRGADHPDTLAARQVLTEAKITAAVEKILATAPPLSDEARIRLAAIFQGGAR